MIELRHKDADGNWMENRNLWKLLPTFQWLQIALPHYELFGVANCVKLPKVLEINKETDRKSTQKEKNEINLKKEHSLKCLKNFCITGCIKKAHTKKTLFIKNWEKC